MNTTPGARLRFRPFRGTWVRHVAFSLLVAMGTATVLTCETMLPDAGSCTSDRPVEVVEDCGLRSGNDPCTDSGTACAEEAARPGGSWQMATDAAECGNGGAASCTGTQDGSTSGTHAECCDSSCGDDGCSGDSCAFPCWYCGCAHSFAPGLVQSVTGTLMLTACSLLHPSSPSILSADRAQQPHPPRVA